MKQIIKPQIKKGNPEWMGAVACAKGVNFTVDIAGAKEVSLLIYEKKGEEPVLEIPITEAFCVGEVGSVFLEIGRAHV